MGTQPPLQIGDVAPNFRPCLLRPNGSIDQLPHSLIFGPCPLWPNGWMHQDATWCGGRPQPRRLCVRWAPSYPPLKGHSPNFLALSVVAKRLYGLRCHLVWSKVTVQATLCSMKTQLPAEKRAHLPPPNCWPMSIVATVAHLSYC